MTNSHDDRHKLVTQTEKDRIVTGEVRVVNPSYWELTALVYQQSNLRQVFQPSASLLNATVTQLAKDRTITSGNITTHKGEPDYTPVKKKGFYTTIQEDTELWAPASGKRFVITDIIVSVGSTMLVYLKDDSEMIWRWHFASYGGAVINLQTPDESEAINNILSITTSAPGYCSIKVLGYEK